MESLLAMDAGQTGIKVRVAGRDAVFPGIRTDQPLLPQLATIAREAIDRSGADVTAVAAGVSGLTAQEADAAALLARVDAFGVRQAMLAHDSTTSFLGALGTAVGSVVAAGTGVVTLAVGREHAARVDGWGHLIGDAGSGYWIGREALDAVMRAFDGRGPATRLAGFARERWPDLTEAYIRLQSDADRVRIVASFAEHVARLAVDGDPEARRITERAGSELAHSVETSLRHVRSSDREAFSVCAIGGVFRSEPLREVFSSRVAASELDITLIDPLGHGIDGAVALAGLDRSHPLAAAISIARS